MKKIESEYQQTRYDQQNGSKGSLQGEQDIGNNGKDNRKYHHTTDPVLTCNGKKLNEAGSSQHGAKNSGIGTGVLLSFGELLHKAN